MARRSSKNSPVAMPMEDMKWRARQDMETLKGAHEIMSDKSRRSAAMAHAKSEMKVMQKIAAPKMGHSLNLDKKR